MTEAELTLRVVERLRERNQGRDITRLALPIVHATLIELAREGYLTLEDPE